MLLLHPAAFEFLLCANPRESANPRANGKARVWHLGLSPEPCPTSCAAANSKQAPPRPRLCIASSVSHNKRFRVAAAAARKGKGLPLFLQAQGFPLLQQQVSAHADRRGYRRRSQAVLYPEGSGVCYAKMTSTLGSVAKSTRPFRADQKSYL